jgi:TolA-binding protein
VAGSSAALASADVERRLGEVLAAKPASRPTPEQRLAAGEVLLRQRNYERAGETFGQVVELFRQGQTGEAVHADALFLLAESYFRADQLLAARRQYLEIVGLGDTRP